MLEARLADCPGAAMVVDLDLGDLAIELIALAVRSGSVRVVAFGPHVATDALAAAREAGAHTVLARGAFATRLPQILTDLAGGGGGGAAKPG